LDEKIAINGAAPINGKRLVIKIGTSSLTHCTGRLDYRHIEEMVSVVCDLKNMGYEIVLVSSGAGGIGLGKINLSGRPEEAAKRRALAAAGQSGLMAIYEELFNIYNQRVAQVLLTKSVLEDPTNYNNIRNVFSEMLAYRVLPIVNENDVVAADEVDSDDLFGDNDTLSAYVAKLVRADVLIVWSDIDGLYNKDPRRYPDAQLIPVVTCIDDETYRMAGDVGTSRGKGGMKTKLDAARIAIDSGIDMIIANSRHPEDLYDILEDKGIATRFKSSVQKIESL
jgi:glutamate 5-kinase